VAFLERCSFSDSEKWKLLQIMNSPKIRLQQLIDTINANMTSFESAASKVSGSLKIMIEQYAATVRNDKTELFGKLKKSLSKTADVYPTLAFPISQIIFTDSCYYGLLSSQLVQQDIPDQNMMLRSLKALSDASRLEIVRLIKQKPMYNLEIAEQLGLTAATMSHHMGVLLACGFVGVTKQDSKVYYHMEEAAARHFIALLDKTLI
jgi:DNA-binding transcriptional ArsR family regulator